MLSKPTHSFHKYSRTTILRQAVEYNEKSAEVASPSLKGVHRAEQRKPESILKEDAVCLSAIGCELVLGVKEVRWSRSSTGKKNRRRRRRAIQRLALYIQFTVIDPKEGPPHLHLHPHACSDIAGAIRRKHTGKLHETNSPVSSLRDVEQQLKENGFICVSLFGC